MQWKVINFWKKCENFAPFLHQFHIECINIVLHKTDFTSASLQNSQNSLIAAVKSRLQWAFILPLVFWHKMPSPSSELQFMTNFLIYTQVFKGYLHYCSTTLRKLSLVMIWGYVGETASIFREKKKENKNHLQSQMVGEPQISATLLPLQPACECTGHSHTAGCSQALCLCGWFYILYASNPDPEEPAGKGGGSQPLDNLIGSKVKMQKCLGWPRKGFVCLRMLQVRAGVLWLQPSSTITDLHTDFSYHLKIFYLPS